MESEKVKVTIVRGGEAEKPAVEIKFNELDDTCICLTNSKTEDVENLFSRIFKKILESKKLVEFYLEDNNCDLYQEITEDIVDQINSEIRQSEEDFEKIITFFNEQV